MPANSNNMPPSTLTDAARPFRVLALDGGGMRGLYAATVLDTIARHFAVQRTTDGLDVGKGFDLITGTSTGGILATALAAGLPLAKVTSLYREDGPKIFTDPTPSGWARVAWMIRNLWKPANTNQHLRATLEAFFGSETLAALYKGNNIPVSVPLRPFSPNT